MTVAPSRTHPGTFDFASFAQHGTWWGYLRENLECPDTYNDDCPGEPNKAGARINSYIATGSHAAYPEGCSNVPILTCGKNGQHAWMWEADHDGDAPWAADNDPSALKPKDPAFWFWSGSWGEDKVVLSPYYRSHQFAPRDQNCAEDNDDESNHCPLDVLGSSVGRAAARARVAEQRSRRMSQCRPWFGASVTALTCAPGRLRRSVERQRSARDPRLRSPASGARPPLAAVSHGDAQRPCRLSPSS
jgi:hypothetical protein